MQDGCVLPRVPLRLTLGCCTGCSFGAETPKTFCTVVSQLDRAFMRKKSVKYVRYMDDIIILTKTRSALHRAIANC